MPKNKTPNFGYMLLGLVLLWLGLPIFRFMAGDDSQVISYLVVGSALAIAAYSVLEKKTYFLIAITLILMLVAGSTAAYVTGNKMVTVGVITVQLIFWVLASLVVSKFVLSAGRVNINRIFAGVCLYLIAGIIWADIYSIFS